MQEHLSFLSALFTAARFGDPLKCAAVSRCCIHLPSSQLKPTAHKAEKNIEECSMWDICEQHNDEARPPTQKCERTESIFFLLEGRGEKYMAMSCGGRWSWGGGGFCRGAFVPRSQPDVPRASKQDWVHVCNFQQFVRFKGSPPIPPDRQIKSSPRPCNNSKHAGTPRRANLWPSCSFGDKTNPRCESLSLRNLKKSQKFSSAFPSVCVPAEQRCWNPYSLHTL